MVRPPMPPVYLFLIDVSHAAASSGAIAVTCRAIRACLDQLPGDERTRVGFLTYDSTLHFYNLKVWEGEGILRDPRWGCSPTSY